ncbi:MAG TPA: hypothetical protein VMP01_22230 [Pirellulaceae bacterium]|nr:hypothetical protein [Pirellulaceae bacterium]
MPHFACLKDEGVNLDKVSCYGIQGDGSLRLYFSREYFFDVLDPQMVQSVLSAIHSMDVLKGHRPEEVWSSGDGVSL